MSDLKTLQSPLPPNSTIGIIGGGQLGRMLAASAAQLGYRTQVLEPAPSCPAAQLCNTHHRYAYDDEAALAKLAAACDVITYEFENVPLKAAAAIEGLTPLYPPSKALQIAQDRLHEKNFLQKAGLHVAPFYNVETATDLRIALDRFNGGVLKTRRFGYDGKGQHVFNDAHSTMNNQDLEKLLMELGHGPFILEQKIAFKSEFSTIAARALDGTIAIYDPATNIHEAGILRRSLVPAQLSPAQRLKAQTMSEQLLIALDYVGVIGVEFFETDLETDEGLLINEFAPRVHNSGHWTHEACSVSQFEQHIRAITGLPLATTKRHHDCEMLNLLGDEGNNPAALLADSNAQLTLYGKEEPRQGRKMGHLTRLLPLTTKG